MLWIAIDPGVVNIGIVVCEVHDDLVPVRCQNVDLRCLQHQTVSRQKCKLCHESTFPNQFDHFVQEFSLWNADRIVLERQPPQSAGYCLEQFLRDRFFDKLCFVSPRQVSTVYGGLDEPCYEKRKVLSVRKASTALKHLSGWSASSRKHDMADAWCAGLAWFRQERLKQLCQKSSASSEISAFQGDFDVFIAQFSAASDPNTLPLTQSC